ncbi:esterase OVCA2 [Sphaerodactylus townsendi]|uniref:Uncharacterized protein n=1 Tax=Sphaerodactylus townsendi TaxID=933632 RepID=A0ACB8ECK1_9SAUR|nr:esterase OVCA2 [Sphaerodactylus townsendi]
MAEGDSGSRSLRLLCLHGYRQDAKSFRARSGALRKALRGRAELLIIDAPHVVVARPEEASLLDTLDSSGRGWWFSSPQEGTFNAFEEASSCKGLEESLEAVAEAFAEHSPIDGLLGFSQGAALAAIICTLKQGGDPRFQFDFAVLIAGFKSRALDHCSFYQAPIQVPSLHVLGETDRVIPFEMSQELASLFSTPLFLTHLGGHFIPASAAQKKTYLEFLSQFGK